VPLDFQEIIMFSERTEHLTKRGGPLSSEPAVPGLAANDAAEMIRRGNVRTLFEQIVASNGGSAVGVELAFQAPSGTRYCAILEEPDSSGRGRIVYFDAEALHPHHSYASPGEALDQALAEGYVERADGTMDRLATSVAWRRGFAYSALVGRYASGEIDAHQFAAEVRRLG
jgi:hypothetical protein